MGTEDVVLESARRCFGRLGYRKTSMDDVARDAGVAKGTLYLYSRNKQDLFVAAIERELLQWREAQAECIDPERPADEVMVEMATRDAAFVEERPLVAALLCGELDGVVPERRRDLEKMREVGLATVVQVLRLGIDQGVFADDIDVEPTARVLQELHVAGAVLRHRGGLPLRQVRRQQAAAMRLVLHGLQRR